MFHSHQNTPIQAKIFSDPHRWEGYPPHPPLARYQAFCKLIHRCVSQNFSHVLRLRCVRVRNVQCRCIVTKAKRMELRARHHRTQLVCIRRAPGFSYGKGDLPPEVECWISTIIGRFTLICGFKLGSAFRHAQPSQHSPSSCYSGRAAHRKVICMSCQSLLGTLFSEMSCEIG